MEYQENPERDQDRVFDTFDHFKKWGFILFPQNEQIYKSLRARVKGKVLEAGCGVGIGTNLLGKVDVATDKLKKNIDFAKRLYPNIKFDIWDIGEEPYKKEFDTVICIDAIEHVKNYKRAIRNLIASARKEVWISTPNRLRSDEMRPSNEFHVREFSPKEMIEMINEDTEILDWKTFEEVEINTKIDTLVYHIIL